MTGAYPDPIDHRMAYDIDGSSGFHFYQTHILVAFTSDELKRLNNELDDGVVLGDGDSGNAVYAGFIFPQLRDLSGFFLELGNFFTKTSVHVETSTDSTNGLDGTWTDQGSFASSLDGYSIGSVIPEYRTPVPLAVSGIKGFRIVKAAGDLLNLTKLHVYGEIAAGETPDRLILWDPTTDVELSAVALDLGDVSRSSTADTTFRIKNNSSTLTANDVVVELDVLYDATPSIVDQFTFSLDGVTFASTVTVSSIAPGVISDVITMRRTTPSDAALSIWTGRILASPTTMS